jgi:hypothetical protein
MTGRINRSKTWTQGINLLILIPTLFATHISFGNGPVPGFNTTTPYLIYYGNWDSTKVAYARNNYRLVILHPTSNVTAANVATIRRGPDNIAGNSDDVLVLAYISVGEDHRPGVPFVDDGSGPRIDPRASDSVPLSSITNVLGLPSPGGTGYASYYLDNKNSPNGLPDQNSTFGGYYVNAGDPAWQNILKTMTKLSNGRAGLDEILTSTNGISYNCDGVFLDTIETPAPNSFGGTTFEWTAPGMQSLVHFISTNYPGKLLLGNRGLFFFHPNLKTYAYNLRPYLNLVMFESYYTDSGNSGLPSVSFPDNKNNYAPKINAEAGRPDGFTVIGLGYESTPPQSAATITQDYVENMQVQGWALYRTDPALSSAFQTNATLWLATNVDTQMPQWDSTAAQSAVAPAPCIGVQEVVPGNQSVTVRWDVAHDQTGPIRYNLYYSGASTLDFLTATKLTNVVTAMPANYAAGTGAGIYPYEYTVTGLCNGVAYTFAVRAEDSASPSHEDTNTVALSVVAGTNNLAGTYQSITIDGNFNDWSSVPVLALAPFTNVAVGFATLAMANDSNYLYLRFTLHTSGAPFSDFNTHVFVDTDNHSVTGYHPSGLTIGSELMIESGAGFDERNGTFNAGAVSGLGWQLSPAGAGTNFEARISRAVTYPGGALVFTNSTIRLALQDNRGPALTPAGVAYTFAVPDPYETWRAQYFTATELTNASISGDAADPDSDGIANLVEFAFNLHPRVVSSPGLPRGFVQSVSGQICFDVQFTQRNPPAGVQYLMQTSPDLSAWTTSPGSFSQVSSNNSGDGTSLMTMRLQSAITNAPQFFVRIAVQR